MQCAGSHNGIVKVQQWTLRNKPTSVVSPIRSILVYMNKLPKPPSSFWLYEQITEPPSAIQVACPDFSIL